MQSDVQIDKIIQKISLIDKEPDKAKEIDENMKKLKPDFEVGFKCEQEARCGDEIQYTIKLLQQ